MPALRQEVPLEVDAATARERGVRRQAAGAPVPLLLVQGQAARQPRRAHPQAPQQRVVSVRHQQGAPQQEDIRLTDTKVYNTYSTKSVLQSYYLYFTLFIFVEDVF